MENKLIKNPFLEESQDNLQKLAYYGKFLVLSDFDDGWKYQMEKQLLDYLVSLDFSEEDSRININIEQKIEKEKGEIFAILKAESLNTETEDKILEISTNLQKKFLMTPVEQKVGFGSSENGSLKVVLEELNSEDMGYERIEFQKQYSQIILLEQKIKSISYYIQSRDSFNDDISISLIDGLKTLKDTYTDDILSLKESLSKVRSDLYSNLAIKTILDNKDKENTILNKVNKKDLEENNNLQNEEVEIDFSKHSLGKIGECTLDGNGYIVSAKLLDSDEPIYYNDSKGKTLGFHLEGFGSIRYIKPLEYNENKEVILLKAYIGGSNYYYYLENGNYKRFQVDESYVDLRLSNYSFDKNTGKPLYGKVSTVKLDETSFWTEDGEYKIIEKIVGYENIKFIYNIIRDKNGKPLYGKAEVGYETWINFILNENTGKYIKKTLFMKNPYKK